ncbi:MAG: Bug family tripartite tricarboxylate transporter substrate binding protein [Burkholderiales bacterium]
MNGLSYRFVVGVLAAGMLSIDAGALHAQVFPNRPIRIIVPVVPGSFTDLAARALAAELSSSLGQQVITENRPGAGTTLGADLVAKSAPDGHTLLITENSITISSALYAKLPYDPIKDFTPITVVAEAPYILWSRTDWEAKTLRELVAAAKAKPGQVTFASGGQGTSSHLSAELFFEQAGITVIHVPFKGIGGSMTEVMANRVDFGGSSIASPIGNIRAGKLRPLAVTGKSRSPMLPDTPTFTEAGFPGYDASIWFGFLAASGTPAPIIAQLHDELARALIKPAIIDIFQKQGAQVLTIPSAEFARRLAAEIQTWKGLVARRGIKVE